MNQYLVGRRLGGREFDEVGQFGCDNLKALQDRVVPTLLLVSNSDFGSLFIPKQREIDRIRNVAFAELAGRSYIECGNSLRKVPKLSGRNRFGNVRLLRKKRRSVDCNRVGR